MDLELSKKSRKLDQIHLYQQYRYPYPQSRLSIYKFRQNGQLDIYSHRAYTLQWFASDEFLQPVFKPTSSSSLIHGPLVSLKKFLSLSFTSHTNNYCENNSITSNRKSCYLGYLIDYSCKFNEKGVQQIILISF